MVPSSIAGWISTPGHMYVVRCDIIGLATRICNSLNVSCPSSPTFDSGVGAQHSNVSVSKYLINVSTISFLAFPS